MLNQSISTSQHVAYARRTICYRPSVCLSVCVYGPDTRLPYNLYSVTWTTAFRSPLWPIDNIFVLPGIITLLCLYTVSARRTPWTMICMIRRLALTVSDACLKLVFFRVLVDTAH